MGEIGDDPRRIEVIPEEPNAAPTVAASPGTSACA